MNSPPLFECIKSANIEMLQEVLREAESYLDAQLTSAIAADQRAYTFAGAVSAASVILVGAAYSLVTSHPPDTLLAFTAWAVAVSLFVAAWMAVISARSVSFEFVGNQPSKWAADVENGKSFAHAIAEQCAHYDGMIAQNNFVMDRNSKIFNGAVNLALVGIGAGGIAFLLWLGSFIRT
ncbi:hypothetical protein ACWTU6_10265 [Mesorhizobium sp. BHbsci]